MLVLLCIKTHFLESPPRAAWAEGMLVLMLIINQSSVQTWGTLPSLTWEQLHWAAQTRHTPAHSESLTTNFSNRPCFGRLVFAFNFEGHNDRHLTMIDSRI